MQQTKNIPRMEISIYFNLFFLFISDLIDKRNKIARKQQEIYSKY